MENVIHSFYHDQPLYLNIVLQVYAVQLETALRFLLLPLITALAVN